MRFFTIVIFVCIVSLLFTAAALAQPDPSRCIASTSAPPGAWVQVSVNGGGIPLYEARLATGDTVDATIYVTLLDEFDQPVEGWPEEEVWLVSSHGGLAVCAGGTVADATSNEFGEMIFSGDLTAGGFSDLAAGEQLYVVVSGDTLLSYPLDIIFNSTDLDSDGDSDGVDLGLFMTAYFSPEYDFEADLFYDGVESVSDQGKFAEDNMGSCSLGLPGQISVSVAPPGTYALWRLDGPNGFTHDGAGSWVISGLEAGLYTITYTDITCWEEPVPNPDQYDLAPGESHTFTAVYQSYGDISIYPWPTSVSWELIWPEGFDVTYGDSVLEQGCFPPGDYELTFYDEPGWLNTCPDPIVQTLALDDAITFACTFIEYGTVNIDPDPDVPAIDWRLTGPGGVDVSSAGAYTFTTALPGDYTVTWYPEPGWYHECVSPEVKTLPEGGTITFNCTYVERGDVTVSVTPDGIGAGWHLTGPEGFDETRTEDGAFTDLAPGDYTLDWADVSCWTTPTPDPVVQTLAPGGSLVFAGTWIAQGTVHVDPEPDGIGGDWSLEGPSGLVANSTENADFPCLDAGEYTLTWLPVDGWLLSCPEPQVLTLDPGGDITFACTYGEAGVIVIDVEPNALVPCWHLAGPASIDTTDCGDAELDLMPAGAYTVTWLDQADWAEPEPDTVIFSLAALDTVTVTGIWEIRPEITAVTDVGNDQGRQVRVVWRRVLYDAPGDSIDVTGYALYRRQDANRKAVPVRTHAGDKLAGWDYLTTVPARGDTLYQTVAPTLCDSTDTGGICWSTFMVSALTDETLLFYDSRLDRGYSVDNLAPGAPGGLKVDYAAIGNVLAWDEPLETDVREWRVYLGTLDEDSCGGLALTPVATVGSPAWTDDVSGDPWTTCYAVTAVDFAGNEGPATLWSEAGVSGTPHALPTAFALHPPVPNPFNPQTTIAYDLAAVAPVQLAVYDLRGQLVRVLVSEPNVEPGRHEATWQGRDATGRFVAAGVYICRIQAGSESAIMRMTLLK